MVSRALESSSFAELTLFYFIFFVGQRERDSFRFHSEGSPHLGRELNTVE